MIGKSGIGGHQVQNSRTDMGLNLDAVNYFSPSSPFLNIVKCNSMWISDAPLANLTLDTDGYPTAIPSGGTLFGLLIENTNFLPLGNYVVLWDGTGTISYQFDATLVNHGTNRDVINVASNNNGQMRILVTATGGGVGDYVRNLRMVYSPDSTSGTVGVREAALLAGEILDPVFVKLCTPFSRYRTVEWTNCNTNGANAVSAQTTWGGRPTLTQAFWGADESLTYGSGRVLPNGIPFEVICALANKTGADLWLNMPPKADDTYLANAATLVHQLLGASQKAYVEFSNEIWISGTNTNYAATQGAIKFPSAVGTFNQAIDYQVLRTIQMGALWKTAWGADASRVVTVLGSQFTNTGLQTAQLSMLASQDGGDAAQWTGAASGHVDAVAIAPYFGYITPQAWTDPALNGLDLLFKEITTGGPLPSGAGAATTSGSSTAYTLAGTLPATPPKASLVAAKMHATSGAAPTLAVNGGTAFPIVTNIYGVQGVADNGSGKVRITVDNSFGLVTGDTINVAGIGGTTEANGNSQTATVIDFQHIDLTSVSFVHAWTGNGTVSRVAPAGTYTINSTYVFCFTTATASGAVTPCWAQTAASDANSAGMLGQMATYITPQKTINDGLSLQTLGYEFGESLVSPFQFDYTNLFLAAVRDPRMYAVYLSYIADIEATGVTKINHLGDISVYNRFGSWGLIETAFQVSSPKYDGIRDYISRNPNH